jgi:hypothetical protein
VTTEKRSSGTQDINKTKKRKGEKEKRVERRKGQEEELGRRMAMG